MCKIPEWLDHGEDLMLLTPSGRVQGVHSPEKNQTPQKLNTAKSRLDPCLGTETKNAWL